jgi:hypothetical protein
MSALHTFQTGGPKESSLKPGLEFGFSGGKRRRIPDHPILEIVPMPLY